MVRAKDDTRTLTAPEVARTVRSGSSNPALSCLSNEGGYSWQGLVQGDTQGTNRTKAV